jgi:hypothetical protein
MAQEQDEDLVEIDRISNMSDDEIMAEHLAQYGGDKRLADKSISMVQAKITELVNKLCPWKN